MSTAPTIEYAFGADSIAGSLARELIESLRVESIVQLGDLRLVVSELVTNAVVHAGGGTLRVTRTADSILVEVDDCSTAAAIAKPADVARVGGQGLRIVTAASLRWGERPLPGGKTVWAEV